MPRLVWGAAIILFASLLQFHQLGRDQRFTPDEAFFMTFAREAAVKGDWLLPGTLDKPPLSIYLSALSMAAIGIREDEAGVLHLEPLVGEFAGKLPNALLALLLTALTLRLSTRMYRDNRAGIFAALLTAASTYSLAFGASAFTDMSLLCFSAAALHLALGRRWALAGLALGLAMLCKQQAVFSLALVLGLALFSGGMGRRDWLKLLLPLGVCLGGLLLWDAARPETSIFLQAAANNAPADLIAAPATWIGRLLRWLRMSAWLLGPPLATALVMLAAFASLFFGAKPAHSSALPLVFMLALALYGALHIGFNFHIYDRYVLLALPLMIPLAAGGLARLSRSWSRFRAGAILAALIGLGGLWTMQADLPIGGERGTYAGIDRLAAHLNSKPVATVIYDPWLGWQLGYYLGPWHDKRRVHYPTAEALAAGALALDEAGARYFVAPLDEPHDAWLAALGEAGFDAAQDYAQDNFAVYRMTPP